MPIKSCADCTHCLVKLKIPTQTGRELSSADVFRDSRVREIRCAKSQWGLVFSSMAVFEVSAFPKQMAEDCIFYEGDA